MKTLNRTQLKFIAICAMVCDHVAWGFVEFWTPLGQIMHVIGRLTIPIMCFFVAEGFRKTASVKNYIQRMTFFAIVAMLPFYLFFGELYEYRQNIIFDLLLGLLMLAVLEHKKFQKWQKVLFAAIIFFISATIGGWVIMPILYILVFYYVKSFKRQAVWVCGLTVALQVFLITAVELNRIWHFSKYDWPWYDKLYFLGFMLPLFFIKRYNGEKGKDIIGKYFFYLFYPAHFLVLAGIRVLVAGCSAYEIYVGCHVIALLVCIGILFMVLWAKPSRGQSGTLLLVASGCIYTFGFLLEITSGNIGGFYAATVTQYFGETLLMFGFTLFVAEMCHKEVPAFVYAIEGVFGIVIMWMLLTTRENHLFYTYIGINEEGPFPRQVLVYGWGFGLFLAYVGLISVGCFSTCVWSAKRSGGIDKKRCICTAVAIMCLWFPNFIRATGITGGYEIPCLGIILAAILVGMALTRYGYFDSIALAGENALSHGQEGIMVIDNRHIITYFNKRMEEAFGQLALKQDVYKNPVLAEVFEGKKKTLEIKDKIYEMRIEPLNEGGYIQCYMLWMLDITEHHRMLQKISDLAHMDSLTRLYNRSYFVTLLEKYLSEGGGGSLFMMDLDNFKQVNDRFGHQAGDEVLEKFGEVLGAFGKDMFACRIGGDEFCLFSKGIIDAKELGAIAENVSTEFQKKLSTEKYAGITTVSFGIARVIETSDRVFEKLYSNADKALYVAKNRSKNTWYIL
ncbi:MAG: diguanylate cyclase [Lachnospiraceae bacterium]|nr:diguanylate cyclase [Lachnospiraceae bacterium]